MSFRVDSNEDDLTYDNTTTFKKDLSTADDSDDANEFYCKDGKVRISAAIYFVLLKTSCNLKYVYFTQSTNLIDTAKYGDLQSVDVKDKVIDTAKHGDLQSVDVKDKVS